jgi:aquaporin Z
MTAELCGRIVDFAQENPNQGQRERTAPDKPWWLPTRLGHAASEPWKVRSKQMVDVITSRQGSAVTSRQESAVTSRERWRFTAAPHPQLGAAARNYVVEVIGTFFLVFTVAVSVLTHSAYTPLAAGAVLMVMVYAGGHISGGHYNPAVTMAALWRGRIGLANASAYWIVQFAAAVIAGVLARAVVNPAAVTTLHLSGHALSATAVVEFLFTFALCYVVLNVATSKDQPGNSFFGLAIGFTVLAGAFAVGGISGGAFNPAVTLGAAVGGLFAWSTLWVYIAVQAAAGIAAGLAFRALNPTDK